ncbi:hypothetical protein [Paenibacillus pinistramenti]|uniref:hypothetical protein n=1 Tax=Paenibacillus pinistramenti TaxID=1768003 RepID=UPI001109AE43|nr:hypothetical protein [Paenibacillus pinistramenti]
MLTKRQFEEEQAAAIRPLEFVSPQLYQILKNELARLHIHPYDVRAGGSRSGSGIQVELLYGEQFNQLKKGFFEDQEEVQGIEQGIEGGAGEAALFFRQAAEEIKKAMIADYFKMMKP